MSLRLGTQEIAPIIEVGGGSATGIPRIDMTATTATLDSNKFYVWGEVASLDISLAAETAGIENVYKFQFQSGDVATTLSLPADVKWSNNGYPRILQEGTYIVSIESSIAKIDRLHNANPYVTDGLCLQLTANGFDGIKWYDNINGYSFVNYGAVKNGEAIEFSSNAYLNAEQVLNYPLETSTIEVVFMPTTAAITLIWSAPNSAIQFGTLNNGAGVCFSKIRYKTAYSPYLLGHINTISVNSSLMYCNLQGYSFGGADTFGSSPNGINTDSSRRFNGSLYTIRIYDRVLTADEILHNQAADKLIYNF